MRAYARDWNAGFATEFVVVDEHNVVIYQTATTYNKAAEIELPNLVGQPFIPIQEKFDDITYGAQGKRLIQRYEQSESSL